MKVMVIDANPAGAAEIPAHFQGNTDFDVALAASVDEAMLALQQEPFNVALIAIEHADPSTLGVAGLLTEKFPSLQVGFMMDQPTAADAQAIAQRTPVGLIHKPLDPEKLLMALYNHQQKAAVVVSPSVSAAPAGDPGALANFKIVDVIQMCCISQKTGRLVVQDDGREGYIYIHAGSVVHAEIPGLEGEEAVYEMVGWENSQSTLEESVGAPKITVSAGWEHLLMEGVRRKDERGETGNVDLRTEANEAQLIGKMVGPFRVQKKLVSDFWGTMYVALQVAVNRPAALKVLNPGFYDDQDKCHQFISLAGAMAKAQNPYITAVYEAGQSNGLIFYAREHVEGANLKERLKQGQVLPEDLALRVVINIGEALNYEKKNNILHLPLQIDDVLLPDTGVPKLLNNVTMEGGEVSGGEIDEIKRLGEIIKQGMEGAAMASAELKSMLQRMGTAGQAGYSSWDALLQEARQLDLNRRAMKVVRPVATSNVQIPPESTFKIKPWMLWAGIGACLAGFICLAVWQFILRVRTDGARDVDAMVAVGEGPFIYQDNEKQTLPKFYMDKYEVTIAQYAKFLKAWNDNRAGLKEHPDQRPGKDHTPGDWDPIQAAIKGHTPYKGILIQGNTPVFNVDYFDAWAYAAWAGKRLPTEQEWEKAGRGSNGNKYPWGADFVMKKSNTGSDAASGPSDPHFGKDDGFGLWSPVGAMRGDQSHYGAMDMAGNVSEWTDSWDNHPDFSDTKVPVVRGGSWGTTEVRLTTRDCRRSKLQRSPTLGFRCAAENPPAVK